MSSTRCFVGTAGPRSRCDGQSQPERPRRGSRLAGASPVLRAGWPCQMPVLVRGVLVSYPGAAVTSRDGHVVEPVRHRPLAAPPPPMSGDPRPCDMTSGKLSTQWPVQWRRIWTLRPKPWSWFVVMALMKSWGAPGPSHPWIRCSRRRHGRCLAGTAGCCTCWSSATRDHVTTNLASNYPGLLFAFLRSFVQTVAAQHFMLPTKLEGRVRRPGAAPRPVLHRTTQ